MPPSDEGGGCPKGRRKERKIANYSLPQSFASQNPATCGRPGRGSGCPPDSHSLPRLRFAYPRQRGPWCGASRRGFGTGDPSPTKRTTISHSSTCGNDRPPASVPIVGGGFPAPFTGAMSRRRNDRSPTSVPTVGAIHESPADHHLRRAALCASQGVRDGTRPLRGKRGAVRLIRRRWLSLPGGRPLRNHGMIAAGNHWDFRFAALCNTPLRYGLRRVCRNP